MNLTIKLGTQVVSLIGTPKAFKIAKLEQIQKWFVKNEEEINSHLHLPSVVERHNETQEKLKSYMSIIKQSALNDGQGAIYDTKPYFKFLKSQIKVTSPRAEAFDTLNNIDREFLHEYMNLYLMKQPTNSLMSFLEPIVADRACEIVLVPEPNED
jgi:hypothetical protein